MPTLFAILALSSLVAPTQAPSGPMDPWDGAALESTLPAPTRLRSPTGHDGIWSVTLENDLFAGVDTNYSSGFAISFTGGEASRHDPKSFYHRILESSTWLPGIGGEGSENFVGFSLGQTMFTPEDITLANPPADDRPYAGFLFFNTSLFSLRPHSLDAWTLQLGMVGPSSLGEQSQKSIHSLIGSDEPQGWDQQLKDEFIVNVHYEHSHRRWNGKLSRSLDVELIPKFGGGLGNFATYANVGVMGRIGSNMPPTFSGNSLTAGLSSNAPALVPDPSRWGWSLFAGAQGYWVGRYLPLDGNTFSDGPSVDTNDLLSSLTAGLSLGCSTFVSTLSFTAFSEVYENQPERSEFGALSVSWSR